MPYAGSTVSMSAFHHLDRGSYMPEALVESVPAEILHREISGLGVTHILTVPDTHQKSLLATLSVDPAFSYHVLSTEDEALCVNAGLWMGGKEPLVVIQNV